MRLLRAGAIYFASVFAAGFVLGIVRQLAVEPIVGTTAAVVLEAPFILAVSALVARRCVQSYASKSGDAVAIGAAAFGLLLVTEALLAGPVRGWDFAQWLRHFARPDGALSLLLFLAFAAMPWIVWRLSAGQR